MLTVKFEYGTGNAGSTESCEIFESYKEARKFAHKALDEILEEIKSGAQADNGILRIWDDESKGALIDDLCSWEH